MPVVIQATPNVSEPEKVIEALRANNIVVIKNHGTVCIADSFNEAFFLIEGLEEAVRTAAVARLFAKDKLNPFEKELQRNLSQAQKRDLRCFLASISRQ